MNSFFFQLFHVQKIRNCILSLKLTSFEIDFSQSHLGVKFLMQFYNCESLIVCRGTVEQLMKLTKEMKNWYLLGLPDFFVGYILNWFPLAVFCFFFEIQSCKKLFQWLLRECRPLCLETLGQYCWSQKVFKFAYNAHNQSVHVLLNYSFLMWLISLCKCTSSVSIVK